MSGAIKDATKISVIQAADWLAHNPQFGGDLWSRVGTYSGPDLLDELCNEGLLVRTREATYPSWPSYGCEIRWELTAKGRDLLFSLGRDYKSLLLKERAELDRKIQALG
jgi:hypothetical protein